MPVCRICLQQSYKHVFEGNHGEPSVIDKLKSCMNSLDLQMVDKYFCVCEECMNALNTAYELNEKLIAAQNDIRSQMTDANDYGNLSKYAFEASLLRQNVMNPRTTIEFDEETFPKIEEKYSIYIPHLPPEPINSPPTKDSEETPTNEMKETAETLEGTDLHDNAQPELSDVSPESVIHMNANYERLSRFMEGKMCHICYRQYPNRTCLQSHIKAVHMSNANSNSMKRKVLNNLLSSLSSEERKNINGQVAKKCRKTSCEQCQITLKCMHEMQYHVTAIHKKYPMTNVHFNVVCDICNMEFSHCYLKLHHRGHELQVQMSDIFAKVHVKKTGPFMVMQFWQCQMCKVIYRSTDHSIQEHQLMHKLSAIKAMRPMH